MSERDSDRDGGDLDTGVVTKTIPKTKKPPMYKVLMLNDDYTPMEFVVYILERFFHKNREQASQIMLHIHRKGVGICGEMAGNPVAALLLMAMGYQVLSMNSPNLMIVKKVLTTVSYEQSQLLLEEVLQMDSAAQIKKRAESVLRENGLSQIIRSRG